MSIKGLQKRFSREIAASLLTKVDETHNDIMGSQELLKRAGIELSYDKESKKFKVCRAGNKDKSKIYSSEKLHDAVNTGVSMAQRTGKEMAGHPLTMNEALEAKIAQAVMKIKHMAAPGNEHSGDMKAAFEAVMSKSVLGEPIKKKIWALLMG